jgi:hypothetical protein
MLASEVLGEGFPDLVGADVQEVPNYHVNE